MLQFFAKRLKELHEAKADERGFTLIEILVVMGCAGLNGTTNAARARATEQVRS